MCINGSVSMEKPALSQELSPFVGKTAIKPALSQEYVILAEGPSEAQDGPSRCLPY